MFIQSENKEKMVKKLFALLIASVLVCSFAVSAHATLILNGDFENFNDPPGEPAPPGIANMSNPLFNSTIANATAFGDTGIDIIHSSSSFGEPPQSGNWKLGIHTNPLNLQPEAFSLELSSQLNFGASYDLSFWGVQVWGAEVGSIDIGLSVSATNFGTQIFSASALDLNPNTWTQMSHTFVAPSNALFLTVRNGITPDAYNLIDNFSLDLFGPPTEPVPEPSTIALLGIGLVVLIIGYLRRMRKSNISPQSRKERKENIMC